jgi:hypothetical protein
MPQSVVFDSVLVRSSFHEYLNGVEYFSAFMIHRTTGLQRELEALLPVRCMVRIKKPTLFACWTDSNDNCKF